MKKLDADTIWEKHVEPTIDIIDKEGEYRVTASMKKAMRSLFTKGFDFGFEAAINTIVHGLEDAMIEKVAAKRAVRGSYAAKN